MVQPGGVECSIANLEGAVSGLFQDFARYELTVEENVGLADHSRLHDQPAIHDALTRAGANGLVAALPEGLTTRLGRRFTGGFDLSIGQWQRLALARAYFRDAPLLVLDEPSASLDPHAEVALLTSLRNRSAARSVVLISHRYSTVRAADRILVLHEGRVVEQGSHRELLATGGLYADFVRLQVDDYRRSDAVADTTVSTTSPSASSDRG